MTRRSIPMLIAACVLVTPGLRDPEAIVNRASGRAVQPPHQTPAAGLDARTREDFTKRVGEYAELHRKLENTLPALPKDATPQQIDGTQRALAKLIQAARTGAKRGDLFTPEMTAFVKRLMAEFFRGPNGQRLISSIMDENVKTMELGVNQRFPDTIPLASMPPAILKALPELPEQMQYRFVSDQFVLLDQHAHIIADFIPNVLPMR